MADVLAEAAQWAADGGPPNWVFVVAVLTRPAQWSAFIVRAVRQRLGVDGAE